MSCATRNFSQIQAGRLFGDVHQLVNGLTPSNDGPEYVDSRRYVVVMELTSDEVPVVRRAVVAYRRAKKGYRGKFVGRTADQILEELNPTPIRWAALAAFVIETAEGARSGNR